MSSALTKSKKDSDGRLPLRLYYDRGFLFEAPKRAETKTCCSCVQKGTLTKRDKKEIESSENAIVPISNLLSDTPLLPSTLPDQAVTSSSFILHSESGSSSIQSRTLTSKREKRRPSKNLLEKLAVKSRPEDGGMCNVCRVVRYQFFHFGALVCNRCRAFFRRCVRRIRSGLPLTICLTTKMMVSQLTDHTPICDMSVFRGACQICRYATCLKVGMNADSVMTDKARLNKYSKKEKGPKTLNEGDFTIDPAEKSSIFEKLKDDSGVLYLSGSNVMVKQSFPTSTDSEVSIPLSCHVETMESVENFRSVSATSALISNTIVHSNAQEVDSYKSPLSQVAFEDFLYYFKPLREPPWFDKSEDAPAAFNSCPFDQETLSFDFFREEGNVQPTFSDADLGF